jgi:uncharacterized protein (DUF488 family)
MKLCTIGHSNHSLDKFIQLLDENGIMQLVDVRSAPYSRFHPQFNKEDLERGLAPHYIQYAYAGKFLGGRPSDPTCYKNRLLPSDDADYLHEVDYPEVMKRPWFIQGINRLLELADQDLTAIMCSEENPAECHRHHLIAKYLISEHPEVDVHHIRGDGVVFRAKSLSVSVNEPDVKQLSFFEGI